MRVTRSASWPLYPKKRIRNAIFYRQTIFNRVRQTIKDHQTIAIRLMQDDSHKIFAAQIRTTVSTLIYKKAYYGINKNWQCLEYKFNFIKLTYSKQICLE
jgi:hypothetical protein